MDNIFVLSAAVEEMQKNIQRLKGQTMKRYGLGISDFACLMAIKTNGGMTSTNLSRYCRVDKALISRSIKKLLEQNVITYEKPRMPLSEAAARVEIKTRRRGAYRVKLILTEYGEQIAESFFAASGAIAQSAMADVTPEQFETVLNTLNKVNETFQAHMAQQDDSCAVDAE